MDVVFPTISSKDFLEIEKIKEKQHFNAIFKSKK